LRNYVGEQESVRGFCDVFGWNHVTSGIAAVFVVGVGCAFQILLKLPGARCVVLLVGFKFVDGPQRDFESCAVAEGEGGFFDEFTVAGGEREAFCLSGEEGWEEEE
jgi:hypothetical protein